MCPHPTVAHGPAIGNGGAWTVHGGVIGLVPPFLPGPPPPPVLGGQHIHIVSTDNPESKHELTQYGMSEERVQKLKWELMRAWDCLVMDDEMLRQGNLSKDEAWLVLHFLEHAHNAQVYPPPPRSVAIVTTHYAKMLWLQHCVWEAGGKLHGDQAYVCVCT